MPRRAAGRWALPAFGERGTSLNGMAWITCVSWSRAPFAQVLRTLSLKPPLVAARCSFLAIIMTIDAFEASTSQAAGSEYEPRSTGAQVSAPELLDQFFSNLGPPGHHASRGFQMGSPGDACTSVRKQGSSSGWMRNAIRPPGLGWKWSGKPRGQDSNLRFPGS